MNWLNNGSNQVLIETYNQSGNLFSLPMLQIVQSAGGAQGQRSGYEVHLRSLDLRFYWVRDYVTAALRPCEMEFYVWLVKIPMEAEAFGGLALSVKLAYMFDLSGSVASGARPPLWPRNNLYTSYVKIVKRWRQGMPAFYGDVSAAGAPTGAFAARRYVLPVRKHYKAWRGQKVEWTSLATQNPMTNGYFLIGMTWGGPPIGEYGTNDCTAAIYYDWKWRFTDASM